LATPGAVAEAALASAGQREIRATDGRSIFVVKGQHRTHLRGLIQDQVRSKEMIQCTQPPIIWCTNLPNDLFRMCDEMDFIYVCKWRGISPLGSPHSACKFQPNKELS
jgi:hypothetical protein